MEKATLNNWAVEKNTIIIWQRLQLKTQILTKHVYVFVCCEFIYLLSSFLFHYSCRCGEISSEIRVLCLCSLFFLPELLFLQYEIHIFLDLPTYFFVTHLHFAICFNKPFIFTRWPNHVSCVSILLTILVIFNSFHSFLANFVFLGNVFYCSKYFHFHCSYFISQPVC